MEKERFSKGDIQTKVELIQALIPLGLMAVSERLKEDVDELAEERYSRSVFDRGRVRLDSCLCLSITLNW